VPNRLVNAAFVEEVRLLSTGEYCVRIKSGKQYMAARSYKMNLKCLAETWIGTGALFSDWHRSQRSISRYARPGLARIAALSPPPEWQPRSLTPTISSSSRGNTSVLLRAAA
jgi:hypothetical protein